MNLRSKLKDNNNMDMMKSMYDEFASKDESELKEKLAELKQQGKMNGSLTNEKIDDMAKRIMPMLDKEKQDKLKGLINFMKE